jgi:hypothetical protein
MDKWTQACIANSGSQNQWSEKGNTYFFEHTRRDHDDGAICGSIWKFLPDGVHVRKSGSFRINGDGTVAKAPKFLKSLT